MSAPKPTKNAVSSAFVSPPELDLSVYRYNHTPVPELKCNWHDAQALAADLGDRNNPLSKILPDDMKAITRMLTVNRHLAYLDVLMLTDHHKYGNALVKQRRKPSPGTD
ncbi:hypothetical protein PF003_g28666 [Phytophthora fragariae]|nr:hypothetical protein PF003_g28666 [Phytophthora fragariae]